MANELVLRDYQEPIIPALHAGFVAGHKAQILYLPTGGGKTEIAIAMLKAAADRGKRSAMVMDRRVLCDQTSKRLEKYDIDHGVLMAGHWRYHTYKSIQICSAQTLEKRGSLPNMKLLIVDECFPSGTMISTTTGLKDISIVRCGDIVYNSIGVGKVVSVMTRPEIELIKLEYEDGTTIECTENHPIFTNKGWVNADSMEIGRVSYSIKGLHLLWKYFYSINENGRREKSGIKLYLYMEQAINLLKVLLKEVEKSNDESGLTRENESNFKGNKAQAYITGREWEIANSASACFASCAWGWMASGASNSNKDASFRDWLSNLLQAGFSECVDENWNRNRRWISRLTREESKRFEENRISCFPRLVNISRIKRESVIPVFNLHIEGHPSYFANGKLVHNCHNTRGQTAEFIKNNPDIFVIGLSASPFTKGLGKTYSNVINGPTTSQLVDKNMLAPLRVFVAKEIDMSGAKKVAGEWSQAEATERGIKITGDVVNEWIKKTYEIFGEPKKTIVFCAGVAHGLDLSEKFKEAGYNFVSISYKDEDETKKAALEEFSKTDSTIHGLIATDILTKGFDQDDVMIGISARPFTKSFSSHVQQLGRIMRPHADKPDAIWIDHSGNFLRFKDDWQELYHNGVKALDDGKEKAKPEPTDKEKEAAKCSNCGQLWGPFDVCQHCGHIRPRRNTVIAVPGEITEIRIGGSKQVAATSARELYAMCCTYAREHSTPDKQKGRAAHIYKDIIGDWPPKEFIFERTRSELISTPVLNQIKCRNIAFSRARA
jgi:superfamily II DNA or RNA helicase